MAEERDLPELVAAAPDRVLVASGYPTADSYSVATWGRRRGGARDAVFKYSAAAHDVVEVTRSGYRSCSVESPEATFRTGNDAVQLNGVRVRYFICGVPGHCAARMKLEVRVRPAGCRSRSSPVTTRQGRAGTATAGISLTGRANASAAVRSSSTKKPLEGVSEKRLRKWQEPEEPENTATALYIGHIPHGFYEEQMQGEFLCSIDRV